MRIESADILFLSLNGFYLFLFLHAGVSLEDWKMHFRQWKQRLGTCFAALTFSYKGRSPLFCKSIIGWPLSTAKVFFIQISDQ